MPATGRRRHAAEEEESSQEERPVNTQRRRQTQRDEDEDDDEEDEDGDDTAGNDRDADEEEDSQDQLVKKLVRYALACEYQRMPIRRTGISEKVIGKQRGRFKKTFEAAQVQLRTKFGMELVELPAREKVTLKERRAAQKTKGNSNTSTSYILTSTLPAKYRTAEIIPPSKIGNPSAESAYIAFYTFIVSIITLSPQGVLSDIKLGRYLQRVLADDIMPLDKTENIIARMIKQGYIVKTVERTENDETIEYRVGPRGKVEVGNDGIQGMVRAVYGENAPEDLDRRLRRSLGIENAEDMEVDEDDEEEQPVQASVVESTQNKRSGRR